MAGVIVGRLDNDLAIRIPAEIPESIGLREGDEVELELRDGDILIRRQSARERAETAVAEIIAERENYSLGGITIRELIDEGRRY
jgi:antitoxin MazE